MHTCRDCKSGPKAKFCCKVCGHVCKAPHEGSPVCPECRVPMVYMGDKWRPLKKSRRHINARAAQNQADYLRRLRDVQNPG